MVFDMHGNSIVRTCQYTKYYSITMRLFKFALRRCVAGACHKSFNVSKHDVTSPAAKLSRSVSSSSHERDSRYCDAGWICATVMHTIPFPSGPHSVALEGWTVIFDSFFTITTVPNSVLKLNHRNTLTLIKRRRRTSSLIRRTMRLPTTSKTNRMRTVVSTLENDPTRVHA